MTYPSRKHESLDAPGIAPFKPVRALRDVGPLLARHLPFANWAFPHTAPIMAHAL
jgi:hypothetical protein